MSGALKHMFDSTFLHVGGALSDDGSAGDGSAGEGGTAGRPYGLLVHGRYDTAGAVRSVRASPVPTRGRTCTCGGMSAG